MPHPVNKSMKKKFFKSQIPLVVECFGKEGDGRRRQKDYHEFEVDLHYRVKTCFKKQSEKGKQRETEKRKRHRLSCFLEIG